MKRSSPQEGLVHTGWLRSRLILQSLSPGSLTKPRTLKLLWTKIPFLLLSAMDQTFISNEVKSPEVDKLNFSQNSVT